MEWWWLVNREWKGGGECRFLTPEGVLHSGRLGPLNGWRSFWVVYACLTYRGCDMSVRERVCVEGDVPSAVRLVETMTMTERQRERGGTYGPIKGCLRRIIGNHKFHLMKFCKDDKQRQKAILLTWVHIGDKWGACWWERKDNLVKVARIKTNCLKMRQLAHINACMTLSGDWSGIWKQSTSSYNSALNTWPLTLLDHKSFKLPEKCSVTAAIVGFACLVKRPHYGLAGWFTVSLSVLVTKQPQCHHKVSAECKAGCALCNKFPLGKAGPCHSNPAEAIKIPRLSFI